MFASIGIITTATCRTVPNKNAPIKYLFSSKPTLNIDSSLLILKLCINSNIAIDTNAIVLPISKPYKLVPILNATSVSIPIIIPSNIILLHNPSANILFLLFLGFLFIMFLSGASKPIAIAGSESVIRLIHKSCIASNGDFNPKTNPIKIVTISPILVAIKKCIAFRMFSKIFLPCFTASTIVIKLSSAKIMSAAFLATSVPFFPIAIPMSAFFNAGASFTPSPVIATTAPVFWKASTIRTLCSGDTLANTEYLEIFFSNSIFEILSNSFPVIAKSLFPIIPNSFAIALAVKIWSPVIITVFIPAFLQFCTASFTPSLGGSIIPIKPTKIKFCSMVSLSIFVGNLGIVEYATAITLNAFSAILLFRFSIFLIFSLFKILTSPFK